MAADTDTAEIVNIAAADLRWLTFALRNVQVRVPIENARREALIEQFGAAFEKNPRMPKFVLSFTRDQALLLLWSANEGRCRDGDEWLTRGRMQRVFNELTGGKWGVNQA